jgi:predicted O-methyltransferase YrrM
MMDNIWQTVDDYFAGQFVDTDFDDVLKRSRRAGLPEHQVSPLQGSLLHILVRATKAKRVLELGTLASYSSLWLATALPKDGTLVTIEADPRHAAVAADNFAAAGMTERVHLIQDDARVALERLVFEHTAPFDVIFIDADKPNNPTYLALALQLAKPGTLIIGDNVVRDGQVADAETNDDKVRGVRQFCADLGSNPALMSTALQTVGSKGYDGFTLSLVTADVHSD